MQDVSRILDKADKVRRAFGANRGLLIILLALWSVRRKPRVIEACIALVSGGVALAGRIPFPAPGPRATLIKPHILTGIVLDLSERLRTFWLRLGTLVHGTHCVSLTVATGPSRAPPRQASQRAWTGVEHQDRSPIQHQILQTTCTYGVYGSLG
jgi:hypothetical protein